MKGLSCVMGNYHAQFLGGLGAAMPPGYPVLADIWFSGKILKVTYVSIISEVIMGKIYK